MMKTVWHFTHHYYSGHLVKPWVLTLPHGAQPLGIHYEAGVLGIWVLFDPVEMTSQSWVVLGVRMGKEFAVPEGSAPHYLGVAEQAGPETLHYFAFREKENP